MNATQYHPLVHRMAVGTAVTALLPIVIGAVVTTLGAGMAFLDWPSSDGQNMLLYPWLKDLASGRIDKFVEHGHRLAGIVIGLCSIALAVALWLREPRLWVRILGTAVLLGVIAQGLLGGARVLADARQLAMLHGTTAAFVFTLMAVTAAVTGRRWIELSARSDVARPSRALKVLAVAAPAAILVQYLLGGLLRHFGTALHEHLGMAVVAFLLTMAAAHVAFHRGDRSLRRPAVWLSLAALLQVSLGAGAWITRFGFATLGYVPVQQTLEQTVLRSSHTVVGMLLFASSVLLALRVLQVDRLARRSVPEAITGDSYSGVIGSKPLLGPAVSTGGAR